MESQPASPVPSRPIPIWPAGQGRAGAKVQDIRHDRDPTTRAFLVCREGGGGGGREGERERGREGEGERGRERERERGREGVD